MNESNTVVVSTEGFNCMESLVIVNWTYASPDYGNLIYPEKDGCLMNSLLTDSGYHKVEVVENVPDIEECVTKFISSHESSLERFHFHYSGIHSVENIKII